MATDPSAQPLWLLVLSTSAISAAVSASVSAFSSFRTKRADFINDYYKTVIKRRIVAYEQLEQITLNIRNAELEKAQKALRQISDYNL